MPRQTNEEKLTEQIKLLLTDTMLRELQDLALVHDRSVSEYIRHVLGLHIFGHGRMVRGPRKPSRD